ncbi:HNH endonuclease [Micromonospora chalcea]|uniref:HNH endonuclease n=1 Tax=Micromonospora chalcea TaxID=1874 RepID=UPI0037929E62
MKLAAIKRADVLAAISEFDRLGRDEFLATYGFGQARSYYLEFDGRLYDSKAIMGYAHGESAGRRLRYDDFTGGDKSVAQRLRALGFLVRTGRNPDWTRDEIILACSLVEANGWRQLTDTDPRVIELSELLQSAAIHPFEQRRSDFRNPAGVARKTADIATRHPDYSGKRTNGNRLDAKVLQEFLEHPEEMRSLAAVISEAIQRGGEAIDLVPDPDLTDMALQEGDVLRREHLRRERNPRLKAAKIADAKRRSVPLDCEACGFNFAAAYGERGYEYIECHHRTPLHHSGKTVTRLKDLALICSNCHRMIHRTSHWLTVEQLQKLVVGQQRRGQR